MGQAISVVHQYAFSTVPNRERRSTLRTRLQGFAIVAIALMAVMLGGAGDAQSVEYVVANIGTLGGQQSIGRAINELGHVTGSAETPIEDIHAYNNHAFVYDGVIHDQGALDEFGSFGYAINNFDHVAGYASMPHHAFIRDDAGMRDLGTLGGLESMARGINDRGHVVGSSNPAVSSLEHAFFYNGVDMLDLGTFGGPRSDAYGINENDLVTGFAMTAQNAAHAFLYDGVVKHDLGTLGGTHSAGYALNDLGQVAGASQQLGDTNQGHAFFYDGVQMIDLGTLGGATSAANGVNNLGQVVGVSLVTTDNRSHAFLWDQAHGMVDLNTLVAADSGWDFDFAAGINDAGQITGRGRYFGMPVAFLMTPVPEPGSFLLAAIAGVTPIGYWLRRTSRRMIS